MITILGKPLRGPSILARLVLLVALSLLLMISDQRSQRLVKIRATLMTAIYPLQAIAAFPVALLREVADGFASERALQAENEELKTDRTQLLVKLQQFDALAAENQRLYDMLGSSKRVADRVLAADLIQVSLEPFSRRVLIARGTQDGIYAGQPVIDAHGIMGQVTGTSSNLATATLITDPSHTIPALASRSGLRVMVVGTGDPDLVSIPYLTATADIKEGDLLVSSGMGGKFPPGYPVAEVAHIVNDPNEPFLAVTARPAARLNHGKQVLVIWPGQTAKSLPPQAWPGDQK